MLAKNELPIQQLLEAGEPILQLKFLKQVMEYPASSQQIQQVTDNLVSSQVIHALLKDVNPEGQIPYYPYDKWFGAHWVLAILADMAYPPGDGSLRPLLEQSYSWLLSKEHEKRILNINGRVRRCASQEGNCVFYSIALGLSDDRTEELAARLIKWRWDDGGWNCDKRPEANKSSFHESLIPLRGLAWYEKASGDPKARMSVDKAADVFLRRYLFKRLANGDVMDKSFIELHYPHYWHYDILFGLKVLMEAGYLDDPRCQDALDLLQAKRLPDGGFPAEARYYRVDEKKLTGHSRVDWGGTSKIHMNPYVTCDALSVLKRAGRIVL